MIITKETDYALRILRALQDGKKHHTAKVSEEHRIPAPFAYKIVKKLAGAGLVENRRGQDGGIQAVCGYDTVTLYDVVRIFEGETYLSACTSPDFVCPWARENGGCSVNAALCRLERETASSMQAIPLSKLFQPVKGPLD